MLTKSLSLFKNHRHLPKSLLTTQQANFAFSTFQPKNQQEFRPNYNFALLIAPLALAVYLADDQTRNKVVVAECEASRADKIRGSYENKIRFFSSPEKVFEVFSSITTEAGEIRMSYGDFLHALTPYTYGELNNGSDEYLKKNSERIAHIIDYDGDGSISFTEFVFFLTFLQIPSGVLRKTFKKYEGAKMTKEQFVQEFSKLRHKTTQGSKQVNKVAIDARGIVATEDDFQKTNLHLADRLFENKKYLTYIDCCNIKQDIRTELWKYEFECYDTDENDTIHVSDFLRTMLSSMKNTKIEKTIKRINKICKHFTDEESRVKFEEFIAFQHFMDNIDQLKAKVSQYRYLDYDMFQSVVIAFCVNNDYCKKNKVVITEAQTKAIFLLLDSDDSGELEQEEVIEVLGDRQALGQNKEAKAKEDIKQLVTKFINKAQKKYREYTSY